MRPGEVTDSVSDLVLYSSIEHGIKRVIEHGIEHGIEFYIKSVLERGIKSVL